MVILITQRVGTIKNSDRIIVINEGQIDSIGTYKELSKSSNVFKEFISQSVVYNTKRELRNTAYLLQEDLKRRKGYKKSRYSGDLIKDEKLSTTTRTEYYTEDLNNALINIVPKINMKKMLQSKIPLTNWNSILYSIEGIC